MGLIKLTAYANTVRRIKSLHPGIEWNTTSNISTMIRNSQNQII